MRKLLIILAVLCFLPVSSHAQLWKLQRYEATGSLGTTQFFGDIGGYSKGDNLLGFKDISFNQTRFNINGSLRYRVLEDVTARVSLTFGAFHSTDIKGSNENRGFESRTMFFEPAIIGEYYCLKNKRENSYLLMKGVGGDPKPFFASLDCYLFTGIGVLTYNVKPNDKLAPRATATKGVTPVIPIGAGVNLIYSSDLNFGIELGGRFTFTDNIDGYTSQYSKANDRYLFFNFTCTYKFKLKERGVQMFSNNKRR